MRVIIVSKALPVVICRQDIIEEECVPMATFFCLDKTRFIKKFVLLYLLENFKWVKMQ